MKTTKINEIITAIDLQHEKLRLDLDELASDVQSSFIRIESDASVKTQQINELIESAANIQNSLYDITQRLDFHDAIENIKHVVKDEVLLCKDDSFIEVEVYSVYTRYTGIVKVGIRTTYGYIFLFDIALSEMSTLRDSVVDVNERVYNWYRSFTLIGKILVCWNDVEKAYIKSKAK